MRFEISIFLITYLFTYVDEDEDEGLAAYYQSGVCENCEWHAV